MQGLSSALPVLGGQVGLLDMGKVSEPPPLWQLSSHPATSVAHPGIKLKGIKHEDCLKKAVQSSVRPATARPSLIQYQLDNGLLKLQGEGAHHQEGRQVKVLPAQA